MVYTFNDFEWDLEKAISNFLKHGIRFEAATEVFDDPGSVILEDTAHSTSSEHRYRLIGESQGKVLLVVFTIRPPDLRSRIISARDANRKEKSIYEKAKKADA